MEPAFSKTLKEAHQPPRSRGSFGALVSLTVLAIIYGSLIPFEYRPATFQQAVHQILNLHAGGSAVANRADLVANLVIYVPLGFLACGALSRRTLTGGIVATIMLGVILAVGVEFAQIWASPRTVSLNDILAELAGLGIGLVLWLAAGPRIVHLAQEALIGSYTALRAGLLLYVGAYLFLELSPFDFFISMSELNGRLQSANPIVLVSGHYGVGLRAAAAMLSKVVSAAPIGAFVYLQTKSWTRVGWVGLALGFGVELVQFFEYSGEADAVSVLLRFLGCGVGFAAVSKLIAIQNKPVFLTAFSWISIPVYVLFMNSLLHSSVTNPGVDYGDIIHQVNWLPFYYFYFSSDQNALSSFANYIKIYAPLGALLWLALDGHRGRAAWAALAAGFIQGGLETLGFWVYFQRPDITNMLIAALGGYLGFGICAWLKRSLADRPKFTSEAQPPPRHHSSGRKHPQIDDEPSTASRLSAALAAVIAYCSFYPFNFALSAFTPERLQRLVDLTDGQFSRGDILGNVLLFVPFGFMEIAALKKSIRSPAKRLLTMLAVSLALAIATQVPQLILPGRDAFAGDIIFNLVGAACGGALGLRLGHLIGSLRVEGRISPGLVFSLLWAAALLAPLLPSVDLSRFKTAVSGLIFPEMFSPGQALVLITGWLVLAELWRGRMDRYLAIAGLALALSPLFGVRLSWTFVVSPIAALVMAKAVGRLPIAVRTVGLMIFMAIGVIVDHIDPSLYGGGARFPWLNELLRVAFFIAALIYFATRLSLRLHVGAGLALGLLLLLSAVSVSLDQSVWVGFDIFVLLLGLLTAALAKRYSSAEVAAAS